MNFVSGRPKRSCFLPTTCKTTQCICSLTAFRTQEDPHRGAEVGAHLLAQINVCIRIDLGIEKTNDLQCVLQRCVS